MAYITYYLNGSSLSSATSIFTDIGLTTLATDGHYSNGAVSRQQVSGVLQAASVCEDCVPDFFFPGLQDVVLSPDGLKVFLSEVTNARVVQYTLSTAFDVNSTWTLVGNITPGGAFAPTAAKFNSTGTKMFILSTGFPDSVLEYSLASPYSIVGSSFTTELNVVALGLPQRLVGLSFNDIGTKMFISGGAGPENRLFEFSLSIGFDLTSGVTSVGNVTLPLLQGIVGMEWANSGNTLYLANSNAGVGSIIEYTATSGPYTTTTLTLVNTNSGIDNITGLHLFDSDNRAIVSKLVSAAVGDVVTVNLL
jgi:hypothetical protein